MTKYLSLMLVFSLSMIHSRDSKSAVEKLCTVNTDDNSKAQINQLFSTNDTATTTYNGSITLTGKNSKSFHVYCTDMSDFPFDMELCQSKKNINGHAEDDCQSFLSKKVTHHGGLAIYLTDWATKDLLKDVVLKYEWNGSEFVHIRQAYYYIGKRKKALRSFTIFEEKKGKKKVALIAKGSLVEVVLYDMERNYLIKSPTGLLGWVKAPSIISDLETDIDGLNEYNMVLPE